MQDDVSEIKNRLSAIEKNISSLEELMRLLLANQMLNNLEIKKPPKEIIQGRATIRYGYAYLRGFYWKYAVVIEGKIITNCKFRILRNGKNIFEGTEMELLSSKHETTITSANADENFLINIKNFPTSELELNDIIEAYKLE